MSEYADRVLACRDCSSEFVFSSGEQEFYATRGFSEPTRCPDCRVARKAARGGGGGGRDSFGGYGSYDDGGGPRAPRQMFKVTCAECGVETEVLV